jgi:RHS repeat-associated protein
VQTHNGETQHIHYNAQGQRIAESGANGNLIREYLYLGNQPIALVVAHAGEQANQPTAPVEPWILDSEADNTLITGVWRVSSYYPDYQGTGYLYSVANQNIPSANIIDTDQATLVGSWKSSTATPGYIGPNYRYAAKGDGTTSATWPVAANGPNELWVIYTSGSNRASNATYTAHHADGQTNVTVDQSQNGGTWALLGNFNLDANSRVVLTNLANSYVIADASRIGDDSNNPEYASVTWPITVPQTGRYKVYGTWNSGSSRASNAKYTINAGPNQQTSIQNQRLNGGQWNLLGEYTFDIADNRNGQNNVSLSAEANGYLIADSIKLEPIEENPPIPSGLFYIHNDHLGTPKRLTDTQGQVVWSLQTTPFGEVHEEVANGITFLMGFPGQYRDSETGLSYNYYRDYDPSIGRYVQSDPIGLGGGVNTYGYVEGNSVSLIDPNGLVAQACLIPPIGAACASLAQWAGGFIVSGIVAITMGSTPGDTPIYSEMSSSEKQRRKAAYSAYKNFASKGYTKNGDPCHDLKEKIDFHRQLANKKEVFDLEFPHRDFPEGAHSKEIKKYRDWADDWENEFNQLCGPECN